MRLNIYCNAEIKPKSWCSKRLGITLCLAVMLTLPAVSALPQSTVRTKPEEKVVARIMQSVVTVQAIASPNAASAQSLGPYREGSGIVIDRDTIVTVGYLLIEAETADIIDNQGRKIPTTILGHDPVSGFGLLKTLIPLKQFPVTLGDSDLLASPQRLLTLGQGESEVTELLLASRKPFAGNWEYLVDAPLLTIPAVNNWSGAGLFDDRGALVGLGSLLVADATDEPRPRPGNLYIPINLFKSVLPDLLRFGRRSGPAQPWLGVHSEPHPQGGLVIQRIAAKSPAELAGLQQGDRILALQDQAILSLADFYRRIWASGPTGSALALSVVREGVTLRITLITGDRLKAQQRPSGV
ncbi:MAG: serine protease [Betaproteobacteria bacterium]|nr:serine protease [Betaproteobacteria bacterium]